MNLHTALDDRSIWQQRRGLVTTHRRRTGFGQVIQHVTFLLVQRGNRRQDALNKVAAVFALRAEAATSPQDGPPSSFGGRRRRPPQRPPRRNPRSALLLVGSTPSTRTNVHSATSSLRMFSHVRRVLSDASAVPSRTRSPTRPWMGCMAV